jgi:pimeloyl-ACP methyl ester carboxylesterase
MPYADSSGVRLYYEEVGKGTPIVFVHEFADDLYSWEPQIRFFSRRYRCIAYNARGYPPSDVPKSHTKYSQQIATDDIASVMKHLKLSKAHIIGCSMGGYATVHFGLRHPKLAISLTAIGVGYGSDPDKRRQFLGIQFQNKDPRGFAHFCAEFAKHSALGSGNTLRGVQARRPTIQSLERGLAKMKVPLHMVSGDEDNNCLEPSVFIKRACPSACLTVVPNTGHAVNLEEPDFFNRITAEFLAQVDSGLYRARDPRYFNPSTMAKK